MFLNMYVIHDLYLCRKDGLKHLKEFYGQLLIKLPYRKADYYPVTFIIDILCFVVIIIGFKKFTV